MQRNPTVTRAAQYVRVSTDQQQYSIANQRAVIAVWAETRDMQIVCTYEDAGRSGLTLEGRPALRQLIADAMASPKPFDAILVYDVSRWGRFQDADESAHLEYLCRSAGVTVHYCAEPFSNDGSAMANLCKVMKRALAAEYSRELSEKIKLGKARLASYGFHQGSVPGYGFRRRLLDQHGADKGLLADGERKNLITDRVVPTLGPAEEIDTVRQMYMWYLEKGATMTNVRCKLNARGVLNAGKPWTKKTVHNVLTSAKYMGDDVWGMTSVTLGKRISRPREAWSVRTAAFDPIVSRAVFHRVQRKRKSIATQWTDEQLLAELRKFQASEGRISRRRLAAHGLHAKVLENHFGSIARACELCGFNYEKTPSTLHRPP